MKSLGSRLLGIGARGALHAQAGVLGGTGLELLNALDLLVGGP